MCFVCLGNICRSPTAEVVMHDLARQRGFGDLVEVESGGTSAWHLGAPADPRSQAEWEAHGLRHDHVARQFGPHDLARFDIVLAMDSTNLAALHRMASAMGSTTTVEMLRAFDRTAGSGAEVPDPYYGSPEGFGDVYEMVVRACAGLLDHLVAEGRLPAGGPAGV